MPNQAIRKETKSLNAMGAAVDDGISLHKSIQHRGVFARLSRIMTTSAQSPDDSLHHLICSRLYLLSGSILENVNRTIASGRIYAQEGLRKALSETNTVGQKIGASEIDSMRSFLSDTNIDKMGDRWPKGRDDFKQTLAQMVAGEGDYSNRQKRDFLQFLVNQYTRDAKIPSLKVKFYEGSGHGKGYYAPKEGKKQARVKLDINSPALNDFAYMASIALWGATRHKFHCQKPWRLFGANDNPTAKNNREVAAKAAARDARARLKERAAPLTGLAA